MKAEWKGSTIALKRLTNITYVSEFEGETELMNKIKHPNVLKYLDYQSYQGNHFIFLEFMIHGSLDVYLRSNKESVDKEMLKDL